MIFGSSSRIAARILAVAIYASCSACDGVGPISQLAFVQQPSQGTASRYFGIQPEVEIQDAAGERVADSTLPVTLSKSEGPGAISGPHLTVNAVAGVAVFEGLSGNTAGEYKLQAALPINCVNCPTTAITTESASFQIDVGAMYSLSFTTQPVGGTGGLAFPTQPVITIEDAGGNTISTSTSPVTLSKCNSTRFLPASAYPPPDGDLLPAGSTTMNAVAGVVIYNGLIFNKVGKYKIEAKTQAIPGPAASSYVVIAEGAPAQIAFSTQPQGGTGGMPLSTQPVVSILDAGGNVVTASSQTITITKQSGPGSVTGSNSVVAVAGIATFASLVVDKTGDYVITATLARQPANPDLTTQSSPFSVTTGPVDQIAFTTQPAGGVSNVAFTTQPAVSLLDKGGNTVTTETSSVTLSVNSGPSSGVLSGNIIKAAVAGVTTYIDVSADKAGTYTLGASMNTLTAQSMEFTVFSGPVDHLAFTTQPVGGTGGMLLTTQPVIGIKDAANNIVTGETSTITLTKKSGPGTISGNTVETTVNGVATWNDLTADKVGDYVLKADGTNLPNPTAVSMTFTVSLGPVAKIGFETEPVGASGGMPLSTQPVVSIQDQGGNTVTSSTLTIVLSKFSGPGTISPSSALSEVAVAGVASFDGLSANTKGNYEILATTTTALTTRSASFTVTVGPPAEIAFQVQPVGSLKGTPFSTQPVVVVLDAGGNIVTASPLTVSVAKASGPGTLSGSASQVAASGVSTYNDLSFDTAGTYRLSAQAASGGQLFTASSNPFVMTTDGDFNQIFFQAQPQSGAVAFTPQRTVVELKDAQGNIVDTGNTVTLTATGPGIMAGVTTKEAQNGIATFDGLTFDKPGWYTLTSTVNNKNGDLLSESSKRFLVVAAVAADDSTKQIAFQAQPQSGAVAFTPQRTVVELKDAQGNVVNTAATVTITATGPGIMAGVTTKEAQNGIATFDGLTFDKPGWYTLTTTVTDKNGDVLSTSSQRFLVVAPGGPPPPGVDTSSGGSTWWIGVVAGSVGLCFLICLAWFIFAWRKRRRREEEEAAEKMGDLAMAVEVLQLASPTSLQGTDKNIMPVETLSFPQATDQIIINDLVSEVEHAHGNAGGFHSPRNAKIILV